MTQAIRNSFTNNATKDLIDTTIGGAEVDANPLIVADILDGTTQTDLAQYERIDILSTSAHTTSRHALRLLSLDTAAASVIDFLSFEWDPVSDTNLTDGSSGIGVFSVVMPDDADAQAEVASLDVMSVDDAAGAEDAAMNFRLVRQGTVATLLAVGGHDTMVDIVAPASTHTAATNTYNMYVRSSAAQTIPAGTTSIVATLRVDEPNITATGTVTDAATLYVSGAPTEGGTGNYAVWIGTGVLNQDDTTDTTSTTTGSIHTDGGLGIAKALWVGTTSTFVGVSSYAAGSVGAPSITFTGDLNTGIWSPSADVMAASTAGTERMRFVNALVFIGNGTTVAASNSTTAIVIDQLGADDVAFQLLSSTDVAHGLTTGGSYQDATTNTYFSIGKYAAATGGASIGAYAETAGSGVVMNFEAVGGTAANTTKTASGLGVFQFVAMEHNGSNSVSNITADGNIFAVGCLRGGSIPMVFLIDEDGDLFADGGVASTNMVTLYDSLDDVALCSAFDYARHLEGARGLIETEWEDFSKYNEQTLIDLGIFGGPRVGVDQSERGLICYTGLARMTVGAVRQLGRTTAQMQAHYEERIATLEAQVRLLTQGNMN